MAVEDGVTGCRTSWISKILTVGFDPFTTNEARILDFAERAWLKSGLAEALSEPALGGTSTAIDPGVRYVNLAKAAGAFALTLVGLVVPGIPTVPFLLATSYYLARSSPRLNKALLNSAFFGPILREWEAHRGLSAYSKGKLIGLTAAIVVVTVVVTPMNSLVLIVILLISLVSFYEIFRLPGVPVQPREKLQNMPVLSLGPT